MIREDHKRSIKEKIIREGLLKKALEKDDKRRIIKEGS
jgi:hypothetical protein